MLAAVICFILMLTACGPKQEQVSKPVSESVSGSADNTEDVSETVTEEELMLRMSIGETEVAVDWEENESVEALKELCRNAPLTVSMSMYGGFEQVGSLGTDLPRDDVQTQTESGDIVLYSGSQIVVFYGSNSWAYTRLGHVSDQDAAGMEKLLGNGDVTVTFRMSAGE